MGIRQNLSDYVAEELKNRILSGEFKVGDKFPNEFDIAKEYNVSRFTIREAIKKLCTTGIIRIIRGRGTYVNEIKPSSFMKPLLPMLMLDEGDIREIYETRMAIERQTTYLAVSNADEGNLLSMRELVKEMEKCLNNKDMVKYNEFDLKFHYKIAEASKNKILCEVLMTLQDLIKVSLNLVSIAPKAEKSIERHSLIFEAIKNKNHKEAVALMEAHINDGIDYIDKLAKEKVLNV